MVAAARAAHLLTIGAPLASIPPPLFCCDLSFHFSSARTALVVSVGACYASRRRAAQMHGAEAAVQPR
jgi:hypothetical protein